MLDVTYSSRLKRDVNLCVKRGKRLERLKQAVRILQAGEALPPKYRDHTMVGDYVGYRECHVEPDWLLLYVCRENELFLFRTDAHSDLFRQSCAAARGASVPRRPRLRLRCARGIIVPVRRNTYIIASSTGTEE